MRRVFFYNRRLYREAAQRDEKRATELNDKSETITHQGRKLWDWRIPWIPWLYLGKYPRKRMQGKGESGGEWKAVRFGFKPLNVTVLFKSHNIQPEPLQLQFLKLCRSAISSVAYLLKVYTVSQKGSLCLCSELWSVSTYFHNFWQTYTTEN